jgi:hypothetical protein
MESPRDMAASGGGGVDGGVRATAAGSSGMTRGAAVVGVLVWLAACAAQSRTTGVRAPSADAVAGRTAVRILNSPDSRGAPDDPRVTLVAAVAGPENALPVYPAVALEAGCGSGVVPVRIHIGTNGRVVRQSDVPGLSLARDSCHARFAEAVRTAVSQWGFFPAMRRVCDGDGGACKDTPIAIYLDLEFRFEVVSGKGTVTAP